MDFHKLMENKPVFYGVIAGAVAIVLILIIAVCAVAFGSSGKSADGVAVQKSPIISEKIRQL